MIQEQNNQDLVELYRRTQHVPTLVFHQLTTVPGINLYNVNQVYSLIYSALNAKPKTPDHP